MTDIDLGDPLNANTSYVMCIYDQIGGNSRLVVNSAAPGGGACNNQPCWQQGRRPLLYSDRTTIPNGMRKLALKPGPSGRTRVTAIARGGLLALPRMPLKQDQKIIVQLSNTDGVCWSAEFSTPARSNTRTKFVDGAD